MIVDYSLKLKFGRFLVPGEKVAPKRKLKGLTKSRSYKIISYVPNKVLLKNKKGVNTWYKLKYFDLK